MATPSDSIVSREDLRDFLIRCLLATGAKPDHAACLSDVIVMADYRGHYSHGLNRIGPVVGKFCMDLAIQKAKKVGVGWVSARGSNHFGIAGWYALHALKQGLIIEMKDRLGEQLPAGWGVDETGTPSTDTQRVLLKGGILPLGGTEDTSGYKGYGLSMMVEVFCGILSGSDFGPFLRHWSSHSKQTNLGQCFVALDPGVFAPGFTDRMSELLDHCRGLEQVEGESEVLVPGDPERKHMKLCDTLGGIPYHKNQMEFADNVAAKYKVERLRRS